MATASVKPKDTGWFPEWESRPLMIAATSLLVAIVTPVPTAIVSVTVLAVLFYRRLVWVLGFALIGAFLRPVPPLLVTKSSNFSGEVAVVSPARRTVYRTTVFVEHAGRQYRLVLPARQPISLESTYFVAGELKPSPDPYADLDFRQGISGWIVPREDQIKLVNPGPWWAEVSDYLPRRFHNYLNTFDDGTGALIEALVTGQDGYIEYERKDELRRGGVLHLIAASGMQVQALAAIFAFGFSRLPIPRSIQIAAVLSTLLLYATIAGLSVAVIRAVLMVTISSMAPFVRRKYDAISSLGFAALVVLTTNPRFGLMPGFYLSFGGMLGIILAASRLVNLSRARRKAGESLAGAIITAPITAIFFGGVATYGAAATLILSEFASIIMFIGLLGFSIHLMGFALGEMLINPVLSVSAETFLNITQSFARVPGAYFEVSPPDPLPVALLMFCAALFWRPVPVETKN